MSCKVKDKYSCTGFKAWSLLTYNFLCWTAFVSTKCQVLILTKRINYCTTTDLRSLLNCFCFHRYCTCQVSEHRTLVVHVYHVLIPRCHWKWNWNSPGSNHYLPVLWVFCQGAEWDGRHEHVTLLSWWKIVSVVCLRMWILVCVSGRWSSNWNIKLAEFIPLYRSVERLYPQMWYYR